jgi:hypothetical protein
MKRCSMRLQSMQACQSLKKTLMRKLCRKLKTLRKLKDSGRASAFKT